MLSIGQRGFWDEQQRVAKLQEKKPVLTRLAESIPWESFRLLLDKGYSQERKSNAGRKRIDPLILFKMLVLQQLFNLSDEELEFQVNDRRSFEEFVGLGVMNDIPDATTVAFFRERLRKAGVIEESSLRCLRGTLEIRASKPVVVKSLMPLLFLSQNNAIPEKKTTISSLIAYWMDGKKTQIDCGRRI